MSTFHLACRQSDLTPHQLHQLIHNDSALHSNVVTISKAINPAATSLTRAIIVLGPNTIKNMALESVGKP